MGGEKLNLMSHNKNKAIMLDSSGDHTAGTYMVYKKSGVHCLTNLLLLLLLHHAMHAMGGS